MEDIPIRERLFEIEPGMVREGMQLYVMRMLHNDIHVLSMTQVRMVLNDFKTQIENQILALGDGIGDH